jgi:lipopolysaccharide/colanic/teichoic acid biosynthesis glycosyltransferase
MDVIGSVAGILIFSPFFILIPIGIKLTSRGPVFFRQPRVGQHENKFMFLKFRSMYVNNNDEVHKEYVQNLIAKKVSGEAGGNGNGKKVYKITKDRRVTPIGHLLRKTSMDELPQFINVLKGEMSLVGPRPPIPYELEKYDTWHLRRVLEVKPGITGLWQVTGRSSTTFDEMVRLDLQYARNWSPSMDVKILLKTPLAVVAGKGAY